VVAKLRAGGIASWAEISLRVLLKIEAGWTHVGDFLSKAGKNVNVLYRLAACRGYCTRS
jgi:hypothetical protein